MLITRQMLREARTPRNQLMTSTRSGKLLETIFNREWPGGMEVTLENCQKAVEIGLGVEWMITYLFPDMIEDWERAIAPERKALCELETKAQEIYAATIIEPQELCAEAIDQARAIYQNAIARVFSQLIRGGISNANN